MALLLPRTLDCPRCGTPREVTEQRSTVLLGEVVVDFHLGGCIGCRLLSDGDHAGER